VRRDRGWFRYDRSAIDQYCAEHHLRGEPRWLFEHLLVNASDTTGMYEGDLTAIAEHLGVTRWALRRRLRPLEAAGVVLLHSTHAPGFGDLVIVDYATLNPRSRLAQSQGESCESAPLVNGDSCASRARVVRNRTRVVASPHDSPGETPPRTEHQEDQEHSRQPSSEINAVPSRASSRAATPTRRPRKRRINKTVNGDEPGPFEDPDFLDHYRVGTNTRDLEGET
jgi:hypothetical protein